MPLLLRLLPLVIVLLSLSCTVEPEGLPVAHGGKKPVLRPNFAEPIVIARTQFIAVPFAMYVPQAQKAQQFQLSSGFGSYSGSFGSVPLAQTFGGFVNCANIHWNNLIFVDKQTGSSHLLLDHKAVITSAFFPDPEKPADQSRKCLLFAIVETDSNGDGYINSDDAVQLYSASLDGTHLVRLTPPNTQYTDITSDGPDTIYIRILRDSNADHRFNDEDEPTILRVDLTHPAEGTPVVDPQLATRAKNLIEEK